MFYTNFIKKRSPSILNVSNRIFKFRLNLVHILFISGFQIIGSSDIKSSGNNVDYYKIGIIGGGLGGTATAYFLKNGFKDNVSLYLYEPESIGGRLSVSSKFEWKYETGGSIIHPDNLYMNEFVNKFGLHKNKHDCQLLAGIFDGNEYAFVESKWQLFNAAKLFWRYGLDLYWLLKQNNKILESFSKIYDHQKRGLTFKSVEDLLYSMDSTFPDMTKISTESFLKEKKYSDLIIKELVAASTRANYGQSPSVHAFVGAVSVAAGSPDLWSVSGGNKRVAEELLNHSEAVRLKERVTKIAHLSNGKFRVWSEPKVSDPTDFDALAIATPLTEDKSNIQFENFSREFEFPGRYEQIICTMVQGTLNHTTFKFDKIGARVAEILTDNSALVYNSVGVQQPIDSTKCDDVKVYKVFSPKVLSDDHLSLLFSSYDKTEVIPWLAYPHYSSSEDLGGIELVPGLYYNNAIEKAASAMEMSVISAKNTAMLIRHFLMGDEEKETARNEEL